MTHIWRCDAQPQKQNTRRAIDPTASDIVAAASHICLLSRERGRGRRVEMNESAQSYWLCFMQYVKGVQDVQLRSAYTLISADSDTPRT